MSEEISLHVKVLANYSKHDSNLRFQVCGVEWEV